MSGFSAIDLSKLPAPEVIKTVEFEALLAAMKADALTQMPELASFLALESEPVTKLLRVCAYHRMLDRLEFNDGARANMLALSTGTDLDGLAAFWGVKRLVVQDANTTVTPPIPEILESDADLRRRTQLSLEGHSTAGPRGAYVFHALSAHGLVADVSATSPAPGQVVVTVLSKEGDGTASDVLLNAVETALNDDDVRPLGTQLSVQRAQITPYALEAVLTLYHGPDGELVRATAQSRLEDFVAAHHKLGHDITMPALFGAVWVDGIQNVQLVSPANDLVIPANQAAYCTGVTVTIGGRNV